MSRSPVVARHIASHPNAVLEDLHGPMHYAPRAGRIEIGSRRIDSPAEHHSALLRMSGREAHAVVTREPNSRTILLSIHPTDCIDQEDEVAVEHSSEATHSPIADAIGAVRREAMRADAAGEFGLGSTLGPHDPIVDYLARPTVAARELHRRGQLPNESRERLVILLNRVVDTARAEADAVTTIEDQAREVAPVYIMEDTFTLSSMWREVADVYAAALAELTAAE